MEMVGREAEFDLITAAVARSTAEPPVVCIVGQAGIGKSTLAHAVCEWAAASGQRVLSGASVVLSEPIPYAPLIMALGAVGDERLLMVLGGGAQSTRGEIFTNVVRTLRGASKETPTTMVIEDLHWADVATLDLLTFLALSRVPGLSLVFTLRSETIEPKSRLEGFVTDAARIPEAITLDLGPVDLGWVEDLLDERDIDRTSIDAHDIHRRSGGVPLFIDEAIRAAIEGEMSSTSMTMALLRNRLDVLDGWARDIVIGIAIRGRPTPMQLAGDFAGLGGDEGLREAVRAAIDADVLVETDSGLECRHALVAEAAVNELLRDDISAWHGRIAAVLSEQAEADTREIAMHWQFAGRPAETLAYALRAANSGIDAPTERFRLLEMALDARRRVTSATLRLPDLLLEVADAAHRSGRNRRAVQLAREVLESPGLDRLTSTRTWQRLAVYEFDCGDDAAFRHAAHVATQLLEPGDDPHVACLCWAWESYALSWRGEFDAADATARRALECANQSGDTSALAHAHHSLGTSWWLDLDAELSQMDDAIEHLQNATRLARAANDWGLWPRSVIGELQVRRYAVDLRHDTTYAVPTALALEAVNEAFSAGQFLALYYVAGMAAGMLLDMGRLGEARAMLDSLPTIPVEGRPYYFVESARAELAYHEGDAAAANEYLTSVRTTFGEGIEADGNRAWEAALASRVLLCEGSPSEALEVLYDRLPLRLRESPSEMPARVVVEGLAHARFTGTETEAVRWAQRMVTTFADPPLRSSQELEAMAEAARLEGAPDPELWRLSMEVSARIELWVRATYSRYRLAEGLLARGDRDRGEAELRRALDDASEMGLAYQIRDLERLAVRAGIDLARGDRSRPELDLTDRELEVLRLVANGMTNRQIGGELFISPKTAGAHVSHILTKLGVERRGEAAAIAHRLGLDDG